MRSEISVYTKINFCIYEKIFLHIRKFSSAYTQGNRRIYAHLSPPFQLYDEAPFALPPTDVIKELGQEKRALPASS